MLQNSVHTLVCCLIVLQQVDFVDRLTDKSAAKVAPGQQATMQRVAAPIDERPSQERGSAANRLTSAAMTEEERRFFLIALVLFVLAWAGITIITSSLGLAVRGMAEDADVDTSGFSFNYSYAWDIILLVLFSMLVVGSPCVACVLCCCAGAAKAAGAPQGTPAGAQPGYKDQGAQGWHSKDGETRVQGFEGGRSDMTPIQAYRPY